MAMWHWRGLAHSISTLEPLLFSSPSIHIASQSFDPNPTGQPTEDTLTEARIFISEHISNKVKITDLSPSQGCRVFSTTSEMAAVMAVAVPWRKRSWYAGSYTSTGWQKGSKSKSRITTLDSRRTDLWPVHTLLGRIPWNTALGSREVQGSWLISKDLLQAQELLHPNEQGKKQRQ